jgi:hypothetical protein
MFADTFSACSYLPWSLSAPIKPEYPRIDWFKDEMCLAPRVSSERFADGSLRIDLDSEHHATYVWERVAQNDEASIHKPVLERGMDEPVGLLLERELSIQLRARSKKYD